VLTALAINVGSAGAFITFNGDAGTPSALVGTNISGTAANLTAGLVTSIGSLTGDVTSSNRATTLATVNSNVGSFTNASLTVNAKGLVTAASSGTAAGLTVGTTAIASGTSGRILYDNAGVLGEYPITGTGSVMLNTQPSLSANVPGARPNELTIGSALVPTRIFSMEPTDETNYTALIFSQNARRNDTDSGWIRDVADLPMMRTAFEYNYETEGRRQHEFNMDVAPNGAAGAATFPLRMFQGTYITSGTGVGTGAFDFNVILRAGAGFEAGGSFLCTSTSTFNQAATFAGGIHATKIQLGATAGAAIGIDIVPLNSPTQPIAGRSWMRVGGGSSECLMINAGLAGGYVDICTDLGSGLRVWDGTGGHVTYLTTPATGTLRVTTNGSTLGAVEAATGAFTSTTSLLLGTAGSAVGNVGFRNATSGTTTLQPATGALGTGTVTLPLSGTLATLEGANTFTEENVNNKSGAASVTAMKFTGVPFAGTGTTSFPLVYITDANATASTTLNTAGTYFGVNGDGTQDLMNLLKDGTSQFKVGSTGVVKFTGGTLGSGGTAVTLAADNGSTTFLQYGPTGTVALNGYNNGCNLTFTANTTTAAFGNGAVSMQNLTASGTLAVTGATTLGTAGSAVGTIGFNNATSGTTTLQPATGALGTQTVTLPLTGTLATLAGTETLTNKRITQRSGTATSSATPTINTDNVDFYSLTAQAADITSFTTNLSGTPTEGQTLWIAITGTAARAITWGATFEAGAVALPTTTVTTTRLDVAFVWNTVSLKWRCMASG
jgi:hypothetical protein